MIRLTGDDSMLWIKGMLKKAASGVLALLPCSRTESTLRASKGLRPCWTDFFEHSLQLTMLGSSGAFIGYGKEIFNRPIKGIGACSVALIRNVRYMFLRLVHALAWTVRPPFRVD